MALSDRIGMPTAANSTTLPTVGSYWKCLYVHAKASRLERCGAMVRYVCF
jgi:hypothetical protein